MIENKWPNTDERMNNIGLNGNTGEHYGIDLDDKERERKALLEKLNAPHKNLSDRQVGGSHYKKHSIQPWDIVDEYGLGFYEGNVLKYLLRSKDDRREDLQKAMHYLEKILEGLE